VVMRANLAGQVLVTLVAVRRDWADARTIATALATACPAVTGVVLNVNPTAGNRILGDEEHALLGEPTLVDRMGEVTVRLSSRAFAQANRAVAARIYGDILAAAPAGVRRAVDAYAGAAPIALSLAAVAAEVVAIEENGAATAAAAAHIASLPGAAGSVRMVTGDASQCLEEVPAADFVVLDPPRKGCGVRVLAAVARLRPQRVAYLSCDATTLARDLVVLVAGGARLLGVTPYDMMPHTPHVETLALLAYDQSDRAQAGGAGPTAAPASSALP
jgi:23S rRNA (uracil1939-C5)-methyltransferase